MDISYSKGDLHLSLVVISVFMGLFAVNFAADIENTFPGLYSAASFISKITILILFLFCLPTVIRRIDAFIILFFLCYVLVILCNYLLFPQTRVLLQGTVSYFLLTCAPPFICFYTIQNYDIFWCLLKRSCHIFCIALIILFSITKIAGIPINNGNYSMGLSYACLLPVSVELLTAFLDRKASHIILCIFSTIIIMLIGSRTPILSLIILFAILTVKNFKQIKHPSIILILVLTILITVIFREEIFGAINNYFEARNIFIRTIYLFAQPGIHLSGRDILQKPLLQQLFNNPFAIRGIHSDMVAIGTYAHNLFLELLYQFGFILSLPLLAALIGLSISSIKGNLKSADGQVALILFCTSIPELMVSGTFWRSISFWMWVAVCMRVMTRKKRLVNITFQGGYHVLEK